MEKKNYIKKLLFFFLKGSKKSQNYEIIFLE
jgi:hypothetical protein